MYWLSIIQRLSVWSRIYLDNGVSPFLNSAVIYCYSTANIPAKCSFTYKISRYFIAVVNSAKSVNTYGVCIKHKHEKKNKIYYSHSQYGPFASMLKCISLCVLLGLEMMHYICSSRVHIATHRYGATRQFIIIIHGSPKSRRQCIVFKSETRRTLCMRNGCQTVWYSHSSVFIENYFKRGKWPPFETNTAVWVANKEQWDSNFN